MASAVPALQFSKIKTAADNASQSFTGEKLLKLKTCVSEIEDVIVKKDHQQYDGLLSNITTLKSVIKGSLANAKVKMLNNSISELEKGLKSLKSRGTNPFAFIKMPDDMHVQGQRAPSTNDKSRTNSARTDKAQMDGIKAELEKLERDLKLKHKEFIGQEPQTFKHDDNNILSTISSIKLLSQSFTERLEKMGPKADVAGLKEKKINETFETTALWLTTLKSEIKADVYNEKYSSTSKSLELGKNREIILEIVKILNSRREQHQRHEDEMESVLQQLSELEKEVETANYQKKLTYPTPKEKLPKRLKDVRVKLNTQWQKVTKRSEEERTLVVQELCELEKEVKTVKFQTNIKLQPTKEELPKRIQDVRVNLNTQWEKLTKSEKANGKKKPEEHDLNSQIMKIWNDFKPESENTQKRVLPTVPAAALKELEKSLHKQREAIQEYENTHDTLQPEMQGLKTDVNDWESKEMTGSDIIIDKQAAKLVHELREIRSLLNAEKKKQLSENRNRKSASDRNSSQIRTLVKSLSNVAFGETPVADSDDGRGEDVEGILNEVTTELKRLHRLKKDLEDEIQCLHTETENWDCSVAESGETVNKNTDILKSLRQIRKNLQQRKKDITEQTHVKDEKEKQIDNNIATLWKAVFEETEAESREASRDSRTLLNQVTTRLEEERLDVQMFIDESKNTFREIQSIVLHKPFLFTEPRGLDRKDVIKNTSYKVLHPVKISIAWIRQCLQENSKSFKERFVNYETYSSLEESHRLLQQTAEKLEAEKIDLSNRLSKVAGARLTDNNPNIADLSDPNRPTKLGEQYSELYDNQWTDAFDDLKQKEEKDRIAFLLHILVGSYKACTEISVVQQKSLKRVLVYPSENTEDKNRGKAAEKDLGLTSLQSKTLVELRKQCADLSVESVRKQIKTEHQDWFKKGALEKYTAKCIDLCWLMQAQSPPVCIDDKLKTGVRVNSNMYKSYTKSGKEVHFFVWPALLLHDGGSILIKGVAQLK